MIEYFLQLSWETDDRSGEDAVRRRCTEISAGDICQCQRFAILLSNTHNIIK